MQLLKKLLSAALLAFMHQPCHAQIAGSNKNDRPVFLSVARLSVLQKGNDFFAKYRVSVNNSSSDTLFYHEHPCAMKYYKLSISEIKFEDSGCADGKKELIKVAPGTKHSREILLTGKTRDIASNPAFRIFFSCTQRNIKSGQKRVTTLRTPELHLSDQ